MWMYVVVFLAAFAVDTIPVFAPPAWVLLIFLVVRFHLNPWVAVLVGVAGSTLGRYVLTTLHRPRVTDGPLLPPVAAALGKLSMQLPVVFPVHPRTRARLAGVELAASPDLHLIDPVGYLEFLALEASAAAVVTDSGGVQEETTYLGVPCFTLRENTERPVTVELGTNRVVGTDPERILREAERALGRERAAEPPRVPPLWDGRTADRILDAILESTGST